MKEFKISTIDEEPVVTLGAEQCEVTDFEQDGGVEIECEFELLNDVTASGIPEKLSIRVRSSDGFSTGFFHELVLHVKAAASGSFSCPTRRTKSGKDGSA